MASPFVGVRAYDDERGAACEEASSVGDALVDVRVGVRRVLDVERARHLVVLGTALGDRRRRALVPDMSSRR